ncbi:MAG: hypothetical protein CMK09_03410 [Ponticaulis sp.]|nr:hypothetical protein [Ponticaulis sp.]
MAGITRIYEITLASKPSLSLQNALDFLHGSREVSVSDVFVSHKSERRPAARHLARLVQSYGYSVWADYEALPEDGFNRALEGELNAAGAVLVLWCQHSVKSPWVIEQARMARESGRIIPLLMETVDLPLGFASMATHDLSDWDGTGRSPLLDPVLEAIADKTGKRPQMEYDALKTYEASWRDFGAPRWTQFALGPPVTGDEAVSAVPPDPKTEQAEEKTGSTETKTGQNKGFSPDEDVFEKIFGEVFGKGKDEGTADEPGRGPDLRVSYQITLEQAFTGLKPEISFKRRVPCVACEGYGAPKSERSGACASCSGSGKVEKEQGFFRMSQTCPACKGSGQKGKACGACEGKGLIEQAETVKVTIPAGMENGKKLMLVGKGDYGRPGKQADGPPVAPTSGDLYLDVAFQKHAVFELNGLDLICRYLVKDSVLRKGGSVKVTGIDGKQLKLSVPKKSEPGSRFRLTGCGMRNLNGTRGDLFVQLVTQT